VSLLAIALLTRKVYSLTILLAARTAAADVIASTRRSLPPVLVYTASPPITIESATSSPTQPVTLLHAITWLLVLLLVIVTGLLFFKIIRWWIKRNLHPFTKLNLRVINTDSNQSTTIFWQTLPLPPTSYTVRIRNLDLEFETANVTCFRSEIKIVNQCFTIEMKPITADVIALKPTIVISRRQKRKLRRILSKPHQILLEMLDQTDTQFALILVRTSMIGNGLVLNTSSEPICDPVTVPLHEHSTHLYPTLPRAESQPIPIN